MRFPPPFPQTRLDSLIADIQDLQLNDGSILKSYRHNEHDPVEGNPVGISLFPTPFPKELFNEAVDLQPIFSKLYASVAEDEEWLAGALSHLIRENRFVRIFWEIHKLVKKIGYAQDFNLGIFRSDYMLHTELNFASYPRCIQLKQVKFNTIACAGGVHADKVHDIHHYLRRSGGYVPQNRVDSKTIMEVFDVSRALLPKNDNMAVLVTGLRQAHMMYGPPTVVKRTCILMIVQPNNINIADERPIEYGLFKADPPVNTFRVVFEEVKSHVHLTPNRTLLYRHTTGEDLEVTVVYFRAGLEAQEYNDIGIEVRILLERSRAIKCPSILSYLTAFKKVQQQLAMPGILERYLTDEEAQRARRTFMPMYSLEGTEEEVQARNSSVNTANVGNYILKSSLQGSKHSVYGTAIPEFLRCLPDRGRSSYILMEKIQPPKLKNILLSGEGVYDGPVVSELRVLGVCLWRRTTPPKLPLVCIHPQLLPSWTFTTKAGNLKENGIDVANGSAHFDTPAIVDCNTLEACSLRAAQEINQLAILKDMELHPTLNLPVQSPHDAYLPEMPYYGYE